VCVCWIVFFKHVFYHQAEEENGSNLTNKDPLTLCLGFFLPFLPDFNLLTNWGAVVFGSWKIQLQPGISLLLMEANSVYGLF